MAITLDGTTGIASVDGSATSPSVRGADSNSGIVYAADTVSISTGGSERLEVDSSGNIDIPDNGKIRLGGSGDLSLWHDGSNTKIENIIRGISNGGVELFQDNVRKFRTSGHGITTDAIMPDADNTYDLGGSSLRWDDVYATNGTIQTSDKNEKNTIVDTDLGLSFVNKLKPVSYKFNNKTRTHYGLIAQDVETILSDISKPTTGFAGFIKEDIPDKLYEEEDEIPEGKKVGDLKTAAHTTYGLRYGEFISPLIKAVQELSAEVETLKTKVAALEAK